MSDNQKPLAHEKKESQSMKPHKKNSQSNEQWGVSFVLAVSVHALLFVGLFVVFQWNRVSDEVVYAELWAPAQIASTPAEPVKVEKPQEVEQPKPEPEPEPEPEPAPPPEPPKPQEQAPSEPPEDVIRQQDEEKKKLEEQKRLEEEKRLEEQRKLEEQKRLEEEKRKAEEKKRQEQRRREQAKRLAQQMQQQEMQRLQQTSQNNAAGVSASMGGAQSAVYNSRIVACVRRNLIFSVTPDMKSGQYETVYEVTLLENGQQAAAPKLLKASGLPAYDRAVESAIRMCDPFPVPDNGKPPKTIQLTFDPVDSN